MTAREEFVAILAANDTPLPWTEGEDGSIFDANGVLVLQADPHGDLDDKRAMAIAAWAVCAVNTCGGFKAVLEP